MKKQEAVENLKYLINGDCTDNQMDFVEEIEMAIDALEKQIPRKPIKANRIINKNGQLFLNDDNEYCKCPICTLYDVPLRENQRYCHYCGQALDWDDHPTEKGGEQE